MGDYARHQRLTKAGYELRKEKKSLWIRLKQWLFRVDYDEED